jgi:hypothetical protein
VVVLARPQPQRPRPHTLDRQQVACPGILRQPGTHPERCDDGRVIDSDPLIAQLDGQVEVALRTGSQFYAVLLERMRDDAKAGGPIRAALRGHERDRVDEWDAFRLLAGVHRIVLSGQAPELEKRYPSTGGDGDAEAAWPAVHELIADGRAEVVDALAHPLQTNAPTRAKALVGALCLIAERTGLPLRLLELGASAGLNLRLDRFRYEQDGTALGPADSPVRFVNFLTGGRPPLATGFQVGERAGCDLNPIDPTTDDGRLTLLACIFPDEHNRFDLLERAIAVARETPARVERADLSSWVAERLAAPRPGMATVVYHTIVWRYLPNDIREAAEAAIAAAGERATDEAPLALLSFEVAETDPSRAELHLTEWPGGRGRLLATSGLHPITVHWH